MSHLRLNPVAPRPAAAPAPVAGGGLSLENQVQLGLNLMLRLKSAALMPAVLALVQARRPQIHVALESLHYVHFARFLPTPDFSTLQVITVYDGDGDDPSGYDLRSYIMDFVAVLHEEFTAILEFVQNAPPLPVEQYPREFLAFVEANNFPVQPWSAYPQMTVIDVQKARVVR